MSNNLSVEEQIDELWDTSGVGKLTRNWYSEEMADLKIEWREQILALLSAERRAGGAEELESLHVDHSRGQESLQDAIDYRITELKG